MRFFFLMVFIGSFAFGQHLHPTDYFASPLEVPIQLSANFGELRTNHFHAGFDIRTEQRTGLNVLAAADGYVSRVKISVYGGGKTLYISHPNGYTTVYCHLQEAVGDIQRYIENYQYKEKAYEVEIFLKPEELPVKKGQLIALSGNTGSSGGPHLHFEIRDTKTEKIINPMFFGFNKKIADTKKPTISALYAYPLSDNATVNQSRKPILINLKAQPDGTYLSDVVAANGEIGFGFTARDKDNVSPFNYGVYKVQSFLNGNSNFEYQFDTYAFDEMRYINALLDYEKLKTTGQKVQQLFMRKKYPLSIIKTNSENGILNVVPNLSLIYRVEVSDFYGNMTIINIPIQYDSFPALIESNSSKSEFFVNSDKDCMYTKGNATVFFPAKTFYNDFDLNFEVNNGVVTVGKNTVPVHDYFTLSIEDATFGANQRDKVFIGEKTKNGIDYNKTTFKDNVFSTKVRNLGSYVLSTDTTPPTVKITKSIEGKTIDTSKPIQFVINDNLSGIASYNGYLNGNWILFEYEYKNKRITYNFTNHNLVEGLNELKVVVTDNVGNSTTFETKFYKK